MVVVLGHGSEFINIGITSWFPVDGVDMFFVLSGFLIGRILLKHENSNKKGNLLKNTMTFYKRRWFRTLPNYFLFLAINLVFIKVGIYDGIININSLAYIPFLQNFFIPLDLMFWESWSLAVEEWFYLLFPILIFVTAIASKRKYAFSYLVACFMFLSVPLIFRMVNYNTGYSPNDIDLFIRKIVVFRLDTIAYGLLGAYIFVKNNNFFRKYSILLFTLGVAGIVLLKVFDFNSGSFFRQSFYYSFQSLFILFWIPIFYRFDKTVKGISWPISFISIISYALYLVHMPILYLIKKYEFTSGNTIIDFTIYLFTAISISFIIYMIWEKPMTDFRKKELKFLNFRF